MKNLLKPTKPDLILTSLCVTLYTKALCVIHGTVMFNLYLHLRKESPTHGTNCVTHVSNLKQFFANNAFAMLAFTSFTLPAKKIKLRRQFLFWPDKAFKQFHTALVRKDKKKENNFPTLSQDLFSYLFIANHYLARFTDFFHTLLWIKCDETKLSSCAFHLIFW